MRPLLMRAGQRRRLSPLYLLIPILYTAVIFALVYFHFSGSERFASSLGQLTVTGERGRAGIDRIRAGWADLAIDLSDRLPLELVVAGTASPVAAETFEVVDNSVQIRFQGGSRLAVREERGRAQWIFTLPEGTTADTARIPLDTAAAIRPLVGTPLAVVARQDHSLVIEGAPGSSFRSDPPALLLRLSSTDTSFRFEQQLGDAASPRLTWLQRTTVTSAAPGREEGVIFAAYERAVADAWPLISQQTMPPADLTDAAASALGAAAEAAYEDDGAALRSLTEEVATTYGELQRQQALAHTPAVLIPFLGLVGDYPSASLAADAARLLDIQRRVGAGDAAVLQQWDLARFVVNRGTSALAEELMRLALAATPKAAADGGGADQPTDRATVATAIGAGAALLDLSRFVPLAQFGDQQSLPEDMRSSALRIVNQHVLPAITVSSDRMLIDAGGFDVGLQLRAAALLTDTTLSDAHHAVGGQLMRTALAMATDDGSIPGGRGDSKRGLAASEVLATLGRSRHLPREVPLYREFGQPNLWVLTAASVSAAASPDSWLLRVGYPVGQQHYLALVGVPNFVELRMHGLRWKTDPEYRRYSDGWAYDADQRTLVLKITQRTVEDDIELVFRR